MRSNCLSTESFSSLLRPFISPKHAVRTVRKSQRHLGFESLEARRVLCTAAAVVPEAAHVPLIEMYGPVQLQQIPQAPSPAAAATPVDLAPVASADQRVATTDAIFANEQAMQQIVPQLEVLEPKAQTQVPDDVNLLGEGENPIPTDPSTNPPPPKDAPPQGPPTPSTDSPPTITSFRFENDEDVWAFSGVVVDDKPVQGLVVVFGGAIAGRSTVVDSCGHFLYIASIPNRPFGAATAQTTDTDGLDSNIFTVYLV